MKNGLLRLKIRLCVYYIQDFASKKNPQIHPNHTRNGSDRYSVTN